MNRIYKLLLLKIIVVIITVDLNGQSTLQGHVIDGSSLDSLPWVQIIYRYEGKIKGGAVSAEKGRFSLKNVDTDSANLVISLVKYRALDTTIAIDSNFMNLTFHLTEDTSKNYLYKSFGYSALMAKNYIEHQDYRLLTPAGFVARTFPGDSAFEKKYNIQFQSLGCHGGREYSAALFNIEMFKYLDRTFGTAWRKEIRKDVVGFEN